MNRALIMLIASGLTLLTCSAAVGEIYTWTDANGTVQYSDRPSEGATVVSVTSRPTDPDAVRERELRRWETATAAERAESEAQAAAADRDAAEADMAAQRAENCKKARQRFATYSQARRIYQNLPDGERRYLTDEETTRAREGAAAAVDEWCGDAS